MDVAAILISMVSVVIVGYGVWWCRNHWPANGFVKVPKTYAEDQHRRAARSESLAQDRTITGEPQPHSRVRRARMSGRRRITTKQPR